MPISFASDASVSASAREKKAPSPSEPSPRRRAFNTARAARSSLEHASAIASARIVEAAPLRECASNASDDADAASV